jgi:cell division protein FtsB
MTTRQRKRSLLKRLWLPALAACFLGYFGFHAFTGYYGIWSSIRFEQEGRELEAELAALKTERQGLEQRVMMLRPESLDADMIDERARLSLNFMRPNEVTIMLPPEDRPAR